MSTSRLSVRSGTLPSMSEAPEILSYRGDSQMSRMSELILTFSVFHSTGDSCYFIPNYYITIIAAFYVNNIL